MSLTPFQHAHFQSPQDTPYSRNSNLEDYDPTFDPNFDEDTVYDGLPPTQSVCPRVDRATHAESPYPEVRSAVANFDDTEMPGEPAELLSSHQRYSSNGEVNTLRAWVIGLFWAILLPGVNQFFFFRYPTVTVGGVCLMTCRAGFTDKLGVISSLPSWYHIRWAGFGLGSCLESRFSVSR